MRAELRQSEDRLQLLLDASLGHGQGAINRRRGRRRQTLCRGGRRHRRASKKEDERARLAKDLQAAHRRQSEFLTTLAHELRNPLAPIRTALDLMRIGQPDSQATERLRGMMERQVSQLAHRWSRSPAGERRRTGRYPKRLASIIT